jgi:hypothetical protein
MIYLMNILNRIFQKEVFILDNNFYTRLLFINLVKLVMKGYNNSYIKGAVCMM